jgi:hypothetical protein
MSPRPSLTLALALALTAAPTLSHAQDAGVAPAVAAPTDEPRRLFEQAMELLNTQRFAEAMPLLERSVSLREHPAALAALAASYRGTGRYLRAIATLERLLAISTDPARDAEVRGVRAECERSLAHVTLRVTGEAAEVLVDGERVATGDVTRTIPLDPGAHTFETRRAGYEPLREERRLDVGAQAEVALDASARPLPATLVIETPQGTTSIRVGGVLVGRGRFSGPIRAGRHGVQVVWDDGHSQERLIELAPGARTVITVNPDRPRPVTARWWFWAGVSAVVAGAVVGAVVVALQPDATPTGNWGHVPNAVYSW